MAITTSKLSGDVLHQFREFTASIDIDSERHHGGEHADGPSVRPSGAIVYGRANDDVAGVFYPEKVGSQQGQKEAVYRTAVAFGIVLDERISLAAQLPCMQSADMNC